MRRCKYAVLILSVLGSVAQADSVLFVNGDQLTGKIVNLTDGKLIFKSDLAGEGCPWPISAR